MSKHAELIARLEAAEVGSRELDALVCVSLGYVGNNQGYAPRNVRISDGAGEWLDYELGPIPYTARIPEVSQSLDAALALALRVLPLGSWRIEREGAIFWAKIWWGREGKAGHKYACAKTPALALCTAILKALEAKQ